MNRLYSFNVSICCLFLSIAGAQTQQRSAPVPDGGPTGYNANLPAQKIGPNDLLAVAVYDAPELTRTVRVSSEGELRLPMLKKRISAQGKFPAEVEVLIADELKSEQILIEPIVTVTIVEYHSHPISIAGAVRNPITFQATSPVTLLEAITRAGGLSPEAGQEILVSRTQPGDGTDPGMVLTQRIPVKGLIDQADSELNLKLFGGEEIRVPENGKVFVVGNVKKPGAFPMASGSETSVMQMLALAEGITGVTNKQAFIYRREASGSKNEIPVDLKKIIDRKAPDVQLMANDILYVPENTNRRMGLAALEKILIFAGTGGATALAYSVIR